MKTRFIKTISSVASLLVTSVTLYASPSNNGYTAHEWGTFTSVEGADGVQIAWNPLSVAELPDFVYSLTWPEGRKAGRENIWLPKPECWRCSGWKRR
jgi:hypothetical protein